MELVLYYLLLVYVLGKRFSLFRCHMLACKSRTNVLYTSRIRSAMRKKKKTSEKPYRNNRGASRVVLPVYPFGEEKTFSPGSVAIVRLIDVKKNVSDYVQRQLSTRWVGGGREKQNDDVPFLLFRRNCIIGVFCSFVSSNG